jgi:hypothetical protein
MLKVKTNAEMNSASRKLSNSTQMSIVIPSRQQRSKEVLAAVNFTFTVIEFTHNAFLSNVDENILTKDLQATLLSEF